MCSLIPGFGVKLSAIILAGPTVLSAVGACPPHHGVRRRWWINVASAVSLIESSQKIGRSHHRHRPGRDIFSRLTAGTFGLVIARYAATSFFDQLNSVRSIHMRCRMTTSLRATATSTGKRTRTYCRRSQDPLRRGVRPGHTKVKNKEKILWDLASDTPICPKVKNNKKIAPYCKAISLGPTNRGYHFPKK
jgi:hypothetical protein